MLSQFVKETILTLSKSISKKREEKGSAQYQVPSKFSVSVD